jgi:hypothetical protein
LRRTARLAESEPSRIAGFGRFDEDATAPDVPEQAAEIRLLRKQNDAQNELAQNGLDIGVLLVLFMYSSTNIPSPSLTP